MEADPIELAPSIQLLHQRVRRSIEYWEDDGVLHPCLKAAGHLVRSGEFLGQESPW
jgi:histidine ammonia-lyase